MENTVFKNVSLITDRPVQGKMKILDKQSDVTIKLDGDEYKGDLQVPGQTHTILYNETKTKIPQVIKQDINSSVRIVGNKIDI